MYSPFVSHRFFGPSILTVVRNGVILEGQGRREGIGLWKAKRAFSGGFGKEEKGGWGSF